MADRNYINDSLNFLGQKVEFYTYKKVDIGTTDFKLGTGMTNLTSNDQGGSYYEKIGNFVHIHVSVSFSATTNDQSTMATKNLFSKIPDEIAPNHTIQAIVNGGARNKIATIWLTGKNFTDTTDQKKKQLYCGSQGTAAIGDLYYFV